MSELRDAIVQVRNELAETKAAAHMEFTSSGDTYVRARAMTRWDVCGEAIWLLDAALAAAGEKGSDE